MEKPKKYAKTQAIFTIFFDSDFEPSVISKILNVKASKIVLRKNAVKNFDNPKGYGYFRLSTNIAEDYVSEMAVTTLLRPFIKNEEQINKITRENNGFCELNLYVKQENNKPFPSITLSPNALKLLGDLKAKYSVNII